jgi:hypothetical protein
MAATRPNPPRTTAKSPGMPKQGNPKPQGNPKSQGAQGAQGAPGAGAGNGLADAGSNALELAGTTVNVALKTTTAAVSAVGDVSQAAFGAASGVSKAASKTITEAANTAASATGIVAALAARAEEMAKARTARQAELEETKKKEQTLALSRSNAKDSAETKKILAEIEAKAAAAVQKTNYDSEIQIKAAELEAKKQKAAIEQQQEDYEKSIASNAEISAVEKIENDKNIKEALEIGLKTDDSPFTRGHVLKNNQYNKSREMFKYYVPIAVVDSQKNFFEIDFIPGENVEKKSNKIFGRDNEGNVVTIDFKYTGLDFFTKDKQYKAVVTVKVKDGTQKEVPGILVCEKREFFIPKAIATGGKSRRQIKKRRLSIKTTQQKKKQRLSVKTQKAIIRNRTKPVIHDAYNYKA